MINKKVYFLISISAIVLSVLSYANPIKINPVNKDYVGAGFNYNAIQQDTLKSNYINFKLNKENVGYNLFAGQRLNKNFAHELGVQKFGKTEWKSNNEKIENKNVYHAYYDAYMLMPIASYLEIFANGGVSYISAEQTNQETNLNEKIKTFGLNYGTGIQININKLLVRGRYMHLVPPKNMNGLNGITDSVNLDVAYYLN